MTGSEWIALLREHAVNLREVGVLSMSVDGASAVLAPRDPAPAPAQSTEPEPANPLKNPALYPDGVVPGYELLGEDAT